MSSYTHRRTIGCAKSSGRRRRNSSAAASASAAPAAIGSSRSASAAACRSSDCVPSTATACASAVGPDPSRTSRASVACATARGPISRTAPRARVVRPRPVGGQRREQLVHEERVAAGRAVADARERRRHVAAQPLGGERGRRDGGERGQVHDRLGAGRERVERLGVGGGLAGPRADHERDRQPADPAGQVGERAHRGRVGPVRVVDHHRSAGPRAARFATSQNSPWSDGERRVRGRPLRGRASTSATGAASAAGPGEQLRALGGRRGGQARLEELADHAERELALELAAAGVEQREPAPPRRARPRCRAARVLPMPGRALDPHERAAARRRVGHDAREEVELAVALEQLRRDGGGHCRVTVRETALPGGPMLWSMSVVAPDARTTPAGRGSPSWLRSLHVELDLRAGEDPIAGVLSVAGRAPSPFSGWVEFLGLLDGVLHAAGREAPEARELRGEGVS